jgi:hypothetical protein
MSRVKEDLPTEAIAKMGLRQSPKSKESPQTIWIADAHRDGGFIVRAKRSDCVFGTGTGDTPVRGEFDRTLL